MVNKIKLLQNHYQLDSTRFVSADEEGGPTLPAPLPADTNTGSLFIAIKGTPDPDSNIRIDIVSGGDLNVALFKYSYDGGSTYWGRLLPDTWNGNGATERIVFADTNNVYASTPIPADTDDDEIIDTVFCTVYSHTTNNIICYKTTDLTGQTPNWTALGTIASSLDDHAARPDLILFVNRLVASYTNGKAIYTKYSDDWGVTWSSGTKLEGTVGNNASSSLALTGNNKIICVYENSDKIQRRISADGASWDVKIDIDTTGTNNTPAVVTDNNGRIIEVHDNVGVLNGRESNDNGDTWSALTATLPTTTGSHWHPTLTKDINGDIYLVASDWSGGNYKLVWSKLINGESTFSDWVDAYAPAKNITHPNVGIMGGQLWVLYYDVVNDDISLVMTKYWEAYSDPTYSSITFTDGGGGLNDLSTADGYTGSASQQAYEVEIDNVASSPDTFKWSKDGGSTYEATGVDCDTGEISLDEGVAISFGAIDGHALGDKWEFIAYPNNGAIAGSEYQETPDGVFLKFTGSDGRVGDYFTIAPDYIYGGELIKQNVPDIGWRSLTTNSAGGIGIVYGLSSGQSIFGDAILLYGCNLSLLKIQGSNTDSGAAWASPSFEATANFSSGITGTVTGIAEGIITDSGLSLTNHIRKGDIIEITSGGASGYMYRIEDIIGTRIFVSPHTMVSDSVSTNDNYKILETKKWVDFSSDFNYTFVRFLIDQQRAPGDDSFHKVGASVLGKALEVNKYPNISSPQSDTHALKVNVSPGGKVTAKKIGAKRRKFNYNFTQLTTVDKENIEAFFDEYEYGLKAMGLLDTYGDPYLVRLTNAELAFTQIPGGTWNISYLTFEEQI